MVSPEQIEQAHSLSGSTSDWRVRCPIASLHTLRALRRIEIEQGIGVCQIQLQRITSAAHQAAFRGFQIPGCQSQHLGGNAICASAGLYGVAASPTARI